MTLSVALRLSSSVKSAAASLRRALSTTYPVEQLNCVKYGEPIVDSLCLNKSELTVGELAPEQVLLKLVASPINPADVNVLQGKYGQLPASLPAAVGNEGLFEVVSSNCRESFKVGDWAVVKRQGIGTWCSHLLASKSDLIRMDKRLGVESAATMLVNPVTAYLLLYSFIKLSEGETVIFNAPTSTVGRALIQICQSRGIQPICIVRDEQFEKDAGELRELGATKIFSNSDLRNKERWSGVPKPRLALNAVGGKHTTDMLRVVADGCTIVTYGGLSLQPVTVPTGCFIFRDHRFLGFWLSRWRDQNYETGLLEGVMSELTELSLSGKLKPPACRQYALTQYKEALEAATSQGVKEKVLFVP